MKSKQNVSDILNKIANIIEVVTGFLLIAVILVMLVRMVRNLCGADLLSDSFDFNIFLSNLFTIIIGVEFTRMLCKHTSETIIEVLLFATARQIIVGNLVPMETLWGVLAIVLLFAVRKFLLSESDGDRNKAIKKLGNRLKKSVRAEKEHDSDPPEI